MYKKIPKSVCAPNALCIDVQGLRVNSEKYDGLSQKFVGLTPTP